MSIPATVPYQFDRLGEALAEYEMAREEGRRIAPRAFLEANADIAAELAPLIEAAEQIEKLASPVCDALSGKAPLAVTAPDGYEILGEIGRGGMGVVYKARQHGTEQLVALKLLRPDWLAGLDDESRRLAMEQFRVEARAAARLRHSNRVRILHLGEHDGRPYYAMELIEGKSLAEKLRQAPGVTREAAVRYLASVADAVQEAHDCGILHRDIKPHNILIDDRTDEALLTDFGLAILPSETPGVAPGEDSVRYQVRVAGTLPYMSPEQTDEFGTVTPRSDIYGLGATLYEVLAGSPPFSGPTRAELVSKIRNDPPPPLGRQDREVNRELASICLACLEKAADKRIGSAHELAERLRAFLEGVRYLRNFTRHGTRMLFMVPFWMLFPLVAFCLLQTACPEWVIWAVMFSGYPLVFVMLAFISRDIRIGLSQQRPRELWAAWIGHLLAAICISLVLRSNFPDHSRTVILSMYAVIASLNGLVNLIDASKLPIRLRWGPFGYWAVAVLMVFHLEWAPIYYCAYNALGTLAYGAVFRRMGRELS